MRTALLCLFFALVTSPVIGDEGIPLKLHEDTLGFHVPIELSGKVVHGQWPSNEHAIYFVEDVLEAFGKPQNILVLEAAVANAFAVLKKDRFGEWGRIILYDPKITETANEGPFSRFYAYRFVLGHEIGHHACRHLTSKTDATPWKLELEADRFAGAALRVWLASQSEETPKWGEHSDLPDGIKSVIPESSSASHPPADLRIKAVQEGWTNGSSC